MQYIEEYDSSFRPSMPIAEITVANPYDGTEVSLRAIIDSGADGSYIPMSVILQFGLTPTEWTNSRGISGVSFRVPIYLVDLKIGRIDAGRVSVVGDEQEQVILGRNVLNWLQTTLDGLGQTLTIEDY